MVRLPIPSRWQIRLLGFLIIIGIGLLIRPLAVSSLEADSQSPVTPVSEAAIAAISTTDAPGPYLLKNASFGPGQRVLLGTLGQTLSGAVRVRVESTDGKPISGVPVTFEIVTRPKNSSDTELTPSATSGEDGIAIADLRFGDSDGQYLIAARTQNMAGEMPRIKASALASSWWVFLVFGLVGGLGLFLYGMELGAAGLQKVAGSRMRAILGTLTTNRFMGVLLGTIVTALVQSSSATTVMVVGFVSAGLMNFVQSLGVIMGANIGTTVTVQLIAFKITDYALLMIGTGFVMTIVTRRKLYTYIGEIVLGFGLIFYGMAVMSTAMSPLRSMPVFSDTLLSLGDRPLLGIVAAAVFTGLVQSSGATIGLAVVLASEGLIDLNAAMPIVFGANIGTTVTTLLAMVGASTDGKRAGVAHLLFNIIGVIVFYPLLTWYVPMIENVTTSMGSLSVPRQVANGHMIFNIVIAFAFLPFLSMLAWVVKRIVPDEPEVEDVSKSRYLNNDLLETPDLALTAAYQEVLHVSESVGGMVGRIVDAFGSEGEKIRVDMSKEGQNVDMLCDELRSYYVRLSQKNLGLMQSREKQGHLSIIDDIRQMAQLLRDEIIHSAASLQEKGVHFSEQGEQDLNEYLSFVVAVHSATDEAMRERSLDKARDARKQKNDGEEFERRLRNSHLE